MGIELVTDIIAWRSPSGVTSKNYRQTFYQEISDEENRQFRGQPEEKRDGWVAEWLERKSREKDRKVDGSAAVRIKEDGRLERVILVEQLFFNGSHSTDQVILNPLHSSTRKYYLEAMISWMRRGVFEFRVDLGHLLTKKNIRGVFEHLRQNKDVDLGIDDIVPV